MRKIWQIFSVAFADTLQNKGEQLVWLLLSIFNTTSILLLWLAAARFGGIHDVAAPFLTLYYITLLIVSQGTMSHAELGVAQDIRTGAISMHLLKPFPYFWLTWLSELSWRIMGIFYTLIIFVGFMILTGGIPGMNTTKIIMALIVAALALFLSYVYKMVLAMSAFFLTEIRPVLELMEVVVIIVGGFLMPLELAPRFIQQIAFHLPFVSMVYYPVRAMLGLVSWVDFPMVVITQMGWILVLGLLFWMLWKLGLREYTAVGQ